MVQQVSRPKPGEEQEKLECRHHWLIEAPTGPVSRGVCQQCDEVREFKNYIEAAPWGEDTSVSQPSGLYKADSPPEESEYFEDL